MSITTTSPSTSPVATLRPVSPLDDPMPPLTVLYDDLCEFCRWTATRLRRWDRSRQLRFSPFHTADRVPMLGDVIRGHDLAEHVHVVDSAGRVAVGSEAVLAIVALLPGGRAVTTLFERSRPAAIALDGLYRLLNRRRGVLADAFHLNGGRLMEPTGLDPESTEIAALEDELDAQRA